jgi:hypothetical protein
MLLILRSFSAREVEQDPPRSGGAPTTDRSEIENSIERLKQSKVEQGSADAAFASAAFVTQRANTQLRGAHYLAWVRTWDAFVKAFSQAFAC